MNSDLPTPMRRLDKGVRVFSWVMVLGVAAASIFVPPETILSVQTAWMSVFWTVLTGLGGLAAVVAVIRGDYWMELIGALAVGAGLSMYALAVWSIVMDASPTRSAQAFALSALVGFVGVQVVNCWIHAYRVRRAYENPPEV